MRTNEINAKLSHCAELMLTPPHTASIDPQIIHDIGVKATEAILTRVYKKQIRIRETQSYEISFNKSKRHETAIYYIAEVTDV